MDDTHEFGSGFKVSIDRCQNRTAFEICSYAAARMVANPNGALTFECSDVAVLFGTMIPSRATIDSLRASLGFGGAPEPHDDLHQHNEQILLFGDELSLEFWLGPRFPPGYTFFGEEDRAAGEGANGQKGRVT